MSLLKQLENPTRRFPYLVRFDLESCVYVFLWDAMFHPEGRDTPKSQVEQTNELLDSWMSSDPKALYKDKLALSGTLSDTYLPEGDDGHAPESFRYLRKCRMALKELLSAISVAYIVWDLEASRHNLDASYASPKWKDLCGNFEPLAVLEKFKAMQTILTEAASV